MKISPVSSSERGGALIVTMLIIVFVALSLSCYFLLTQGEYVSVQRSQSWNTALVMAEAGVEDAMGLINKSVGAGGVQTNWTLTAFSDHWETNNQAAYRLVTTNYFGTNAGFIFHLKQRSPDTNAGFYEVYVNNGSGGGHSGPSILSIGTALWSGAGPSGSGTGSNGITGDIGLSVSYGTNNPQRKLFVQTTSSGLFQGNLGAITTINFNGNNVLADSFDSGDPYHSNWQTVMTYHGTNNYGLYPYTNATDSSTVSAPDYATEPEKRKDNAKVTTPGTILDVGNGSIYGYAYTGPNGFPVSGVNGAIGDVSFIDINNSHGIEAGHAFNDMNVVYQDYPLPTNFPNASSTDGDGYRLNGTAAPNCDIGGKNGIVYNGWNFQFWISVPGYYQISGHGTKPLSLGVYVGTTNVYLYLPAGLNFSGNAAATLYVETNADVTIYSGGNIKTTGPSGTVNPSGINNVSQYAPAFQIWGLPTGVDSVGDNVIGCTSIKLGGNGTVVSVIYAKEASLSCGGGSQTYDCVGAFLVHDIQYNGNQKFHYDEALNNVGPSKGYIPTTWQEVP